MCFTMLQFRMLSQGVFHGDRVPYAESMGGMLQFPILIQGLSL